MGGVDATEMAATRLPFFQSDHLAAFRQHDSRRLGVQPLPLASSAVSVMSWIAYLVRDIGQFLGGRAVKCGD